MKRSISKVQIAQVENEAKQQKHEPEIKHLTTSQLMSNRNDIPIWFFVTETLKIKLIPDTSMCGIDNFHDIIMYARNVIIAIVGNLIEDLKNYTFDIKWLNYTFDVDQMDTYLTILNSMTWLFVNDEELVRWAVLHTNENFWRNYSQSAIESIHIYTIFTNKHYIEIERPLKIVTKSHATSKYDYIRNISPTSRIFILAHLDFTPFNKVASSSNELCAPNLYCSPKYKSYSVMVPKTNIINVIETIEGNINQQLNELDSIEVVNKIIRSSDDKMFFPINESTELISCSESNIPVMDENVHFSISPEFFKKYYEPFYKQQKNYINFNFIDTWNEYREMQNHANNTYQNNQPLVEIDWQKLIETMKYDDERSRLALNYSQNFKVFNKNTLYLMEIQLHQLSKPNTRETYELKMNMKKIIPLVNMLVNSNTVKTSNPKTDCINALRQHALLNANNSSS